MTTSYFILYYILNLFIFHFFYLRTFYTGANVLLFGWLFNHLL